MHQSLNIIIKMKEGRSFENTLFHKSQIAPPYTIEKLYKDATQPGKAVAETNFTKEELDQGFDRIILLKFNNRKSLIEKLEDLEQYPEQDIEYFEEDDINTTAADPNDEHWDELWNIRKIEAPQAWLSSKGEGVIVAVVDSGADLQHRDLDNNLWTHPGANNHGYDFRNNDINPDDDGGHGSHVAGTITAALNNRIGVVGVAPKAKLMVLKGMGSEGSGYTSDLVNCIRYAANHGANVINNSWGPGTGKTVSDVITYAAATKGCFVTFAAGNQNSLVTSNRAAGHSYVISVASVDEDDTRLSSSNYGARVDVSAPGLRIFSTSMTGGYTTKSGTSMACPHVSGLIALLLSLKPDLTFREVKEALQKTAEPHHSERGKPIGSGRINAAKAVQYIVRTCNIVLTNPDAEEIGSE